MSTGRTIAIPAVVALAIALHAVLSPHGPAHATIIRVPEDEPTIQAGVGASSPGDTVLLSPRTYNETVDFIGKAIVVGSRYLTTGGEGYVASTIIDGGGTDGPLVSFTSGEDSLSMLVGLTLHEGRATDGGAVYCSSSSPRISHCDFLCNVATGYGGAVGGWGASPILEDCRFESNSTTGIAGGAIYLRYGSPRIERCVFWGNASQGEGGAMSLQDASPVIADCVIESNTTSTHYAGGIICRNCTAVIARNVFTANVSAWTGGGLFY